MKTPNALPVDLLSGGFIIINILAILFAWDRALNPLGLIRGYGLLLVMIPLLIFADSRIPKANPDHARAARWARTVFDMIRLGYPLMTMLFFYLTVYRFHHLVFPEMLDPYFAAADQHIFGYQPALVWQQRWDNFWISELLHAAYFGYFVILGLLPMAMFFRRREDLNEMVFASVTAYYLAGLTYILLPVAGGRFDPEVLALTESLRHGPFTRLMGLIYRGTKHFGAAFPSTHSAVSAALAMAALRYRLRLRWLVVANALLVWIACVYGGYHYSVDVLAGLIYAGLFFPLGLRLYRLIRKRMEPARN
jgi:membrane-associated phospholipid phosphatase